MPSRLSPPVLIADIGGTNARFALVDAAGNLSRPVHCPVDDYPSLEHSLTERVLPAFGTAPRSAAMAVAAALDGDKIPLTNAPWIIEPPNLIASLGFDEVQLFNDFEAQALALPQFSSTDFAPIGGGVGEPNQPKLVVGAGTGLGVSALMPFEGRLLPVGTEGGHITFGPIDQRDFEVWPALAGGGRITAERIVSGPGIERLYRAIAKTDGADRGSLSAADIADLAERGSDPIAVETIERFTTYLGRFAGDMALVFLARGGVYIGGGIAPKLRRFFEEGGFRRAFEDKQPFGSLVASIPTSIVIAPEPALLGLASFVRDPDRFAIDLSSRSWRRRG